VCVCGGRGGAEARFLIIVFHDWVFDTIPVAARSMAKVCGRTHAEIAGSNHAGCR